MKQKIVITGSFASGFEQHVLDEAALRMLPVPNTPATKRYWDNKFQDLPERTMDELGQLEKLNVAWATTLGEKYLALV